MRITSQEVETLCQSCQIGNEEQPKLVRCITRTYRFGRSSIAEHKDKIQHLVDKFPHSFFEGAGESFSHMLDNPHASDHMESLVALAMGANIATFTYDRNRWDQLPGKVPFIRMYRSREKR